MYCKFQPVHAISLYQSCQEPNTPLQQRAECQPLVPDQRPSLEPRLYVLLDDSYPSPLDGTFSFSGPIPNIFMLIQIPVVTWEAHWVPSESTGLQSKPRTGNGKEPDKQGGEEGALLMSDGSSLSVFTVQQIMAPQALASPVS